MNLQPPAFLQNHLKKLPEFVLKPAVLVPYAVQQQLLQVALNDLFKDHLRDGELDFLAGRYLAVSVDDLDLGWTLTLIRGHLSVVARDSLADVSIRARARDLLLLASRQEDPDTLFFQRRLVIEGDTELGLRVKNIMDSVDWEAMPRPVRSLLERGAAYIQRFG